MVIIFLLTGLGILGYILYRMYQQMEIIGYILKDIDSKYQNTERLVVQFNEVQQKILETVPEFRHIPEIKINEK